MGVVIDKPRCDKCNSSQVYIRLTTDEKVCKTCGNISKIERENAMKDLVESGF